MLNKLIDIVRLLCTPKVFWLLVQKKPISISSFRNVENIKKYTPQLNTIIDAGANRGQFALASHYFFPLSNIYSFEPSKLSFTKMSASLASQANIKLYNFGLGDINGEIDFYENSYDQISSFVRIDVNNENAAYTQSQSKVTKAVIKKMDDIANELILSTPILLKLDVQGYENRVLSGALKTLENIDYILIKLSSGKIIALINPDIVISSEVFEHVADPWQGFREVHRVLKLDGVHIFTVPYYHEIKTRQRAKVDSDGKIIHFLPNRVS